MILAIIERVIRFRWIVLGAVAALVAFSASALRTAALDAIPDISDPQIIVYAKWPRSPQAIETEVTEPIIRALAGSPDVRAIRGTSHMGYSFVYVILQDPGRRAAVRQFVADRLSAIRPQLPPDANVTLGPNASSMGWIFQYALVDKTGTRDLRELRLLNESVVKTALQAAPGVAEVASVGGLEKQFQVKLFPPLLSERGVSLKRVVAAVRGVFEEAGGRTIEVTGREYQLRGGVGSGNIDDLESLVLGRDREGAAVRLRDVGYLQAPARVFGAIGAISAFWLARRAGEMRSLYIIAGSATGAYLVLGLWDSLGAFVMFPVISMVSAASIPIVTDMLNRRIPSEQRATVLSSGQLTLALVMAGFSPLLGSIADAYSLTVGFLAGGVVIGTGSLLALVALGAGSQLRREPATEGAVAAGGD